MKHLFFIFFLVSFTFGQMANGISYDKNSVVKIIKPEKSVVYLNMDFNRDGKKEILSGEKIIKMSDNEYWVHNTELKTEGGDLYTFYAKLKKNEEPVIRQVTADYGYILIFTEDSQLVEIYLAGEKGNKDSDPLFISLN